MSSFECGLENLGNSCYLSAVIQALRAIPEIDEYFTSNQSFKRNRFLLQKSHLAPRKCKEVAWEFLMQLQLMKLEEVSCASPQALFDALSKENEEFCSLEEQDAALAMMSRRLLPSFDCSLTTI
jgi:uncharacterized UBP type Zn finger protein